MPTCCPTSSVRRIIPNSAANITARAVRFTSPGCDRTTRCGRPYLQAAREAQFRIREDFNAEEQEGLGIYQVTQKNGERWSAARGYIHPFMGSRANLRVETHAQATRILFEGKRAVGVEYRQGKETKQIRARREVILSSGAFQTPQLLMLSGVGDSAALAKHGIASTHHLPGVGQNLQDHPDFVFGFTSDAPYFSGLSFGGIARIFKGIAQYRRERRGPMTSNVAECGGFLKTRADLDVPDIQLHFCMAMIDDHGRKPRWGTGFSCHVCLLRPKSRGSVSLQSADPMRAPAIDPNFLAEDTDVDAMVAGFKMTKRLLDAPALKALQTSDVHTAGIETDADIRKVLRERVDTVYHPVGTCKMGVNDPLAVVDPKLKVYGLRGPARRRRLDHADTDRRQHQRADHHDRRKGRRHDQGGDAGGLNRRSRRKPVASGQGCRRFRRVTDGFDAVAIRIENERTIIGGMIAP